MGTIVVKDGTGAPQTIAKVAATGSALSVDSFPVVIASDQGSVPVTNSAEATLIGAVTETAPASDTASSGLNGRLQRAAQRLTSLIALIPTSLGTKTAANSLAVVLASDQPALPISTGASTAAKQPALGTAGAASADVITVQGIASMTALKVDGSAVTQPVSALSLPLPTGAATDTSLGSLTETAPATDTASSGLNGRLQRVAQRITSLMALLPGLGTHVMTGSMAVTLATDDTQVGAKTTGSTLSAGGSGILGWLSDTVTQLKTLVSVNPASLGSKTSANSFPVVIASDQGAITLPTGASTAAKQPALGTAGTPSTDVITVQGATSMTALKVDASATTQPVSAVSLPLPTGASTAAKQPALGTAGSASADVISVQGVASMTALKVDASATTQPVSVASPTWVDKSSTIATGGTQQTLAASNGSRKGFWIQNQSTGSLWINTLANAIVGQPSMEIKPNGLYECGQFLGVPTGAISIIGATTGQAFAAREW